MRVLNPEIDGMRRKTAVIVEREFEALVTVTNALYPTDKRVFHDLSRLKSRYGDVRSVAYCDLQSVVGRELLLLFLQFLLQVSVRIDDEQVFRPAGSPLGMH